MYSHHLLFYFLIVCYQDDKLIIEIILCQRKKKVARKQLTFIKDDKRNFLNLIRHSQKENPVNNYWYSIDKPIDTFNYEYLQTFFLFFNIFTRQTENIHYGLSIQIYLTHGYP